MATKSETVQVTLSVKVPVGTSKTKVEKTVSTLLKNGGSAPEGYKIGSPKVTSGVLASV
jgi:hypothetical protein